MNRVLRWSPIPAALLVLAITGCSGGSSPDGAPVTDKPSASGSAIPEPPSALAATEPAATRTVVLHVTGMMKSASGAT